MRIYQALHSTMLFGGLPTTLNGTDFFIKRLTINDIAHQNGWDVSLQLISPSNDTLRLFRTPGGFGSANWQNVTFTDTASTQAPVGFDIINAK